MIKTHIFKAAFYTMRHRISIFQARLNNNLFEIPGLTPHLSGFKWAFDTMNYLFFNFREQ